MKGPQDQYAEYLRPRLSAWTRRHQRPLGLIGAIAAAGMAAVWVVVVPNKAADSSGAQELAIRWGHPACWVLLAVVGVLVAIDAPKRARDLAGVAAAACYAAFIAGMLL